MCSTILYFVFMWFNLRCYEEMPLQELHTVEAQQTIQNLSDTLRTILRL